jgi:UDP-N-acetylglucosamine--N-acetylmuramyl-(pentapeptide) pyrophosphoryl-undecaprenol N-acetylglucosamine transferase
MLSWQNLTDLFRVPVGVLQALGQILKFHPDAVLSTGGYVSVPAAIAAAIAGIPVLAHEQTAQIGLGNRIVLRFARRIALSFELADKDMPSIARNKTVVTGNPIRSAVLTGDPAKAVAKYGFDNRDRDLPTVYVTGGAQGAHVINEAVKDSLEDLLTFCRIIHQCGKQPGQAVQDRDELREKASKLPDELRRRYAATSFVGPEIGDVFALASVVVSRSGAGTVAEIAALGKAAVYVPLVPTGGDEQRKNARRFEDLGAAIVLDSSLLTGAKLVEALRPLLQDRRRIEAMGQAAHRMSRPDAALSLSNELLSLAGVTTQVVEVVS